MALSHFHNIAQKKLRCQIVNGQEMAKERVKKYRTTYCIHQYLVRFSLVPVYSVSNQAERTFKRRVLFRWCGTDANKWSPPTLNWLTAVWTLFIPKESA